MAIPTNIYFKDYLKAVPILAARRGYLLKSYRKDGSAIRFELFRSQTGTIPEGAIPEKMWVVHESQKIRRIFSDDLKKACKELGVTKKDFDDLIRNKFK